MNSITPLMRIIMDELDTLDENATYDSFLLAIRLYQVTNGAAVDSIDEAINALVDEGLINAERGFRYWEYSLTEAGCAARWALLKAETQARSRLRDYDVSISMRDGDVLPRVGAPAVHFESRAAMRGYLAGAQA